MKIAYSIPEAAAELSISESHCRRMVRAGELPSTRLRGRLVVPHSALVAFLDAAVANASSGGAFGAAESSAEALTPPPSAAAALPSRRLGRSSTAHDDAPDAPASRPSVEGVTN